MEEKELQAMLDSFKTGLPKIEDMKSIQTAFEDFKKEVETKFETQLTSKDLEEINTAIQKQGEALQVMKNQGAKKEQTFKEVYEACLKDLENGIPAKGYQIPTTRKSVTAASRTSSTLAYRESEVGEIQRGVPYLADLFRKVNLGANSGGTARWWEQLAITDNSGTVAEAKKTTASDLTWVEKSLSTKRIKDHIKVSKDQIKDANFIAGEVQRLVDRNMRLKENSQLLSGAGDGNNLNGILSYAQAFATDGISIDGANLMDLIGKIKTQIKVGMKDAALPNYVIANPADIDKIRYAKTDFGQYLFPSLAMGDQPSASGLTIIENSLVTANTLLVGDFGLGTLYVSDDLVIEMTEIDDDAITGMVTIHAYIRENLVVRDVDVNAFVKVTDIDTTIETIKAGA